MERDSMVPLDVGGKTTQLDIEAVFQVDASAAVEGVMKTGVEDECSTSGGATVQGLLGLFRLLVLADEDLLETTAVYFYIAKGMDPRQTQNFLLPRSQVLLLPNTCHAKLYANWHS
jgi:hypothetical protein